MKIDTQLYLISASLFAALTASLFVFGVSKLTKRTTGKIDRFRAQRRDQAVEQMHRHEEAELARKKKEESQESKEHLDNLRQTALIIFGVIIFGGVTFSITGSPVISLVVSSAGFAIPKFWIKWIKSGKEKQMILQMESALELMASVLRSGDGIPGALEKAASEAKYPLRDELQQAVLEDRLGLPAAQVFKNLAERVKMPEMEMVSMAVEMRQSGMSVNLAAVFNQVQDNLRGKQALADEVSALTSENRLAAYIVAFVPFGVIGMFRQMMPDFVAPLFTDPVGIAIFLTMSATIIGGLFWTMNIINKISKEV